MEEIIFLSKKEHEEMENISNLPFKWGKPLEDKEIIVD